MCYNNNFLLFDANLFYTLEVSFQEVHIKGADVFAQYVKSGWESEKHEDFEVINRIVNPEGNSGWATVKHPITK